MVKNLPAVQETWVGSLGWEDSLEKGMATPSSVLAWRNSMDRGAWCATVHGVTKTWTGLGIVTLSFYRPTPLRRDFSCPFGHPWSSVSVQLGFCETCSICRCSLDAFVGRDELHILLLLCHLDLCRCQSQTQVVTVYRLEGPTALSMCLTDLFLWFTEFRRRLLTGHQFIRKEYNLGTPDGRDA